MPQPLPHSWLGAAPEERAGDAVWHVDLGALPPAESDAPAWLSPDERQGAARFLRREDRHRFIRSHQALRFILGGYLARDPAALRFRAGLYGKPELDGPDRGRLRFNLSHSGQHALIGIASVAIGVDVEVYRPIGDPLSIARAHFHPGEVADLTHLSASALVPAFFTCWTRKEAVVKALGLGLSLPLHRFRVTVPPAAAAVLQREQAAASEHGWALHDLDLGPEVAGSVAITRAEAICRCYALRPDWVETA